MRAIRRWGLVGPVKYIERKRRLNEEKEKGNDNEMETKRGDG